MYLDFYLILTLMCFINIEHYSLPGNKFVFQSQRFVLMPWMGVLMYKPDNHSIEEVTNIVLIEHRIAIGNAKDIAAVDNDSLRRYSKAMFYNKGAPWFCRLISYRLHPEYKQGFLNTIAILYLESISDSYLWKPITLMVKRHKISKWSKIFNIGYTDRRSVLEQEMFAMDYVSRTTCEEFYIKEEINFDFLWPRNVLCYKVLNTRNNCVNGAGMALASNITNVWILMGLSTDGPGCSLPARYIEIAPYVRWIKDNIEVKKSGRRSTYYYNAIYEVYGYKSFIDMFFRKIKDRSIVLKPSLANKTEILYGCYYPEDTAVLMYREQDIFTTRNPISIGNYALIFFDQSFESKTCVKLYTNCKAKSDTLLYFYSRTHTEQMPIYESRIPSRVRDIARNNSYMMITDEEYLRDIDMHHLEFKFEFEDMAMINISFYGKFNGSYMPDA